MDSEFLFFFDTMPEMLPVYQTFVKKLGDECGAYSVKVQKTQISFSNKYNFAFVSLPVHRGKGWPEVCMIVTFGLEHQVTHPRIAVSSEPYPNRWTHHVIIRDEGEIDEELMKWIREAYLFSMNKTRRKKQ